MSESKKWEIIKCFPMDWQRVILAYGFDKKKFNKIIEEIKLLNFQMHALECSESSSPLSSVDKHHHKFLRPLTEILKIRRIKGACLICGAIRCYERPYRGVCNCEDRDTIEAYKEEYWPYIVPQLMYYRLFTNRKKYKYGH